MTYRAELERALQVAQRRFRWWPSKARAAIVRDLLEDLRVEEEVQEAPATTATAPAAKT